MKLHPALMIAAALAAGAAGADAQITMSPLSTFGVNGWLAPGTVSWLTSASSDERGLAFANGQLYVSYGSSTTPAVKIVDSLSGAAIGNLSMTGVSGGTRPLATLAAGSDGVVYGANLSAPVSGSAPFKIYRWATDAATPTVAFSSTTITGGRLGDSFTATGGGASTRLAAGESSTSGSGARNGYVVMSTTDGSTYSGTLVGFVGTPPNAGDFRLGITFTDSSHVYGTPGTTFRYTGFSGSSGTLISSYTPTSSSERPMAFASISGHDLLAVGSTGDRHVSIYDLTDPSAPIFITSLITATGANNSNLNGTGQIAWGNFIDLGNGKGSADLYYLDTNNGIQAFVVAVPEPGVFAFIALGLGCFALRRKIRV
jgi:hypothetical protein